MRILLGAGILMASATASLSVIYPDMAAQLSALASTSETLSGLTGIYVAIFVGIPLTQKLYGIMEPKFARLRHEPSEVLTRKAAERQAAAEALTGKETETQEPGKVLTQTTTETAQKKDEEK